MTPAESRMTERPLKSLLGTAQSQVLPPGRRLDLTFLLIGATDSLQQWFHIVGVGLLLQLR